MMKRIIVPLFIVLFFAGSAAEAQVIMSRGRYGGGRFRQPRQQRNQTKFQPVLNVSFGYGYPNLDKYQLPDNLMDQFGYYYKGNINQTGPLNATVDYQFSRTASIGVMVTHGKVSTSYYDNSTSAEALSGSLENTSILLNFVRYMPVSSKVSPYIKTAIGINIWNQNYKDAAGNKAVIDLSQQDLAYQIALGAKFNVTKRAGLFIEAGYGKYILNGGLAFKF